MATNMQLAIFPTSLPTSKLSYYLCWMLGAYNDMHRHSAALSHMADDAYVPKRNAEKLLMRKNVGKKDFKKIPVVLCQ